MGVSSSSRHSPAAWRADRRGPELCQARAFTPPSGCENGTVRPRGARRRVSVSRRQASGRQDPGGVFQTESSWLTFSIHCVMFTRGVRLIVRTAPGAGLRSEPRQNGSWASSSGSRMGGSDRGSAAAAANAPPLSAAFGSPAAGPADGRGGRAPRERAEPGEPREPAPGRTSSGGIRQQARSARRRGHGAGRERRVGWSNGGGEQAGDRVHVLLVVELVP